jgi:hypothetical protein
VKRPSLATLMRRYLTPRLALTIALWRVEAWLAAPLPFLMVAALGRWPGAMAMGAITGLYAAIFLFMMDGEEALRVVREWSESHPWAGRLARLAMRPRWRWLVAVPLVIVLLGPFWRAVALLLMGFRRWEALLVGVGGSLPHAALWTGLVAGGLWEGLLWPHLRGLL